MLFIVLLGFVYFISDCSAVLVRCYMPPLKRVKTQGCGKNVSSEVFYHYNYKTNTCDPRAYDYDCDVPNKDLARYKHDGGINAFALKLYCESYCKRVLVTKEACRLRMCDDPGNGTPDDQGIGFLHYDYKDKKCKPSNIHCDRRTENSFLNTNYGMYSCLKYVQLCSGELDKHRPCNLPPFTGQDSTCQTNMKFYTFNKETLDCEMVHGCTSNPPPNAFKIGRNPRSALAKCLKFLEQCGYNPRKCYTGTYFHSVGNANSVSNNCEDLITGYDHNCNQTVISPCQVHTLLFFPYTNTRSQKLALRQCHSEKKKCRENYEKHRDTPQAKHNVFASREEPHYEQDSYGGYGDDDDFKSNQENVKERNDTNLRYRTTHG